MLEICKKWRGGKMEKWLVSSLCPSSVFDSLSSHRTDGIGKVINGVILVKLVNMWSPDMTERKSFYYFVRFFVVGDDGLRILCWIGTSIRKDHWKTHHT
jgi:hypothetical protein